MLWFWITSWSLSETVSVSVAKTTSAIHCIWSGNGSGSGSEDEEDGYYSLVKKQKNAKKADKKAAYDAMKEANRYVFLMDFPCLVNLLLTLFFL